MFNRRCCLIILFCLTNEAFAKNKHFRFKIKTKQKSIVFTEIEALNLDAAKVKLYKRYPDCQVLSSEEK